MLTQEPTIPICPDCGTRLEGGFSRNLGRCMICLLRVGFDDAEEPDEALSAPVTDRLGNYRIERRDDGSLWELGRGAMGVTYRALDASLRRAVALKRIDSEWVKRGAEARERFMREARTAASPVDQCTVHAHVVNFGNANQLGAFTGTAEFYPNFCEDPPNIRYTGMFDWFAANGDEISGTFEGYLSPTETPGVFDNHETAEVTGGTGRFANAS